MTDNAARIPVEDLVETLMPGARTALRDIDIPALWAWVRSVPTPPRINYRTAHIAIRLTLRELDILVGLAKGCGLTPPELARLVLFDFLRSRGVHLPESAGTRAATAPAGEGEQGAVVR